MLPKESRNAFLSMTYFNRPFRGNAECLPQGDRYLRFFRGFPLRAFFRMTIPKVLFKRGAYEFYGEINVL